MYRERGCLTLLLLVLLSPVYKCAVLEGDWYARDGEPKFNCSNGKIIRAELRCDGYADCSVYWGGRWLDRDTSDEESCSDKDIEEEVEIQTGGRDGGKVVVIGRGDLIRLENANGGNKSMQNQGKTVVLGREDLIRLENANNGYGSQDNFGGGKSVVVGRQDLIRIQNKQTGNDILIEIDGKRNDSDSNENGNSTKTGRTDGIRDSNSVDGSTSITGVVTQNEKPTKLIDLPSQEEINDNINDDDTLNDAPIGGRDDGKNMGPMKSIASQTRG